MYLLSFTLIITGIIVIFLGIKKSHLSFSQVIVNSRSLFIPNIVNLLFLYLLIPLIIYFLTYIIDPSGNELYSRDLNMEFLAIYHIFIFHSYLLPLFSDQVFLGIFLSLIIDFVLFFLTGLLSKSLLKNRNPIIVNVIFFYVIITIMSFIGLYFR